MESKYRLQSLIQFGLAVALLVIVNVLANSRIGGTPLYGALDLTEDRRFTLTENTREQLQALEAPVRVQVLLEGNLPAAYERLRDKVAETLEDMAAYTDWLEYRFDDPLQGPADVVRERQEALQVDNIIPITDFKETAGERSIRAVYPYLIIYYGERRRIVPLLDAAQPNVPLSFQLNQAESLLEYKISRAVDGLTRIDKPLIGVVQGHGELDPGRLYDLSAALREDYEVGPVDLDSFSTLSTEIDLLIVAKPTEPYSDFDAFKLDQYVMNGGKIIWAVDGVAMDYDSLRANGEFYPEPRELGLEELFFRYGFRLGSQLVLDLVNTPIPIATTQGQSGPKFQLVDFPYHVLAVPEADHPIVKNLDPVDLRYPTLLETVGEDAGVQRTVLLSSSDNARRQRLPSPIDLDVQKFSVDLDRFNEADLPLAMLLEGTFRSPYANRLSRENARVLEENGLTFRGQSVPTAMIVISDGDVAANSIKGREVGYLGFNPFNRIQYANKTFLLNAVEYLLNPNGVIASRGKQVKLRLLNEEVAAAEAGFWRALNLGVPLLTLALFGFIFNYVRRRRYGVTP